MGDEPGLRALGQNLLRPLLRRRLPWEFRRAVRVLRTAGRRRLPSFFGVLPQVIQEEAFLLRAAEREFSEAKPEEQLSRVLASSHFDAVAFHRGLAEQSTGLPRFDPLLEPDVVALAVTSPAMEHFEGALSRGLLRRAVKGALPDVVWRRTTKAGIEAACSTLVALARPGLDRLADVSALADLGIVEPRKFATVYQQFVASPSSVELGFRYVWTTLAVEAFLRGAYGLPGRFEGGSA
jgi:hypothetical protein